MKEVPRVNPYNAPFGEMHGTVDQSEELAKLCDKHGTRKAVVRLAGLRILVGRPVPPVFQPSVGVRRSADLKRKHYPHNGDHAVVALIHQPEFGHRAADDNDQEELEARDAITHIVPPIRLGQHKPALLVGVVVELPTHHQHAHMFIECAEIGSGRRQRRNMHCLTVPVLAGLFLAGTSLQIQNEVNNIRANYQGGTEPLGVAAVETVG